MDRIAADLAQLFLLLLLLRLDLVAGLIMMLLSLCLEISTNPGCSERGLVAQRLLLLL